MKLERNSQLFSLAEIFPLANALDFIPISTGEIIFKMNVRADHIQAKIDEWETIHTRTYSH